MMGHRLELICHHVYAGWDGLPIDLSDHDSHGQAIATDYLPDGIAPASGAVRFGRPGSRIRVPAVKAWHSLGGIKVEVIARRRTTPTLVDDHQTLVTGHDSFSFFMSNHHLFAAVRGPALSEGVDSSGSAGFPEYMVPFGKWVTLGFLHDGLDTMELYADGQLIGRRTNLSASVPPVGNLGVGIGNQPYGLDMLWDGDIDEVKVWRVNRYFIDEGFFSRPVSDDVANCWARFFQSLAKALDREPECARQLQAVIDAVLHRLCRSILAKGPETRGRYVKTAQEYRRLWTAGKLDGPEMIKLFADWCNWLRLVGISIEDDPAIMDLLRSDCLKRILGSCTTLDCDPQFAALVKNIRSHCSPSARDSF